MNNVIPMPDRNAHIHGDEGYVEPTAQEIGNRERRIQAKAALLMHDPEWLDAELDGLTFTSHTVLTLVDCFQYIKPAMKEMEHVPLMRLGSALVVLRSVMRLHEATLLRARKQAEEWADE